MGGNGGSDAGGSETVSGITVVNEKYIVFKRDTWDWTEVSPKDEVHDAVVIRLQDVFAESALWTYANEIRAAMEILRLMYPASVDSDVLMERLDGIADYFAQMADAAGRVTKKVPD